MTEHGTRMRSRRDETGAAVIMAMLIVAIVAMVVSGVFYRQGVIARSIENTASASQVNWLMAGAVDWVRVILREDARSSATDHLAEPWAVPLAQTRLYNDEGQSAWLTGGISDAQSRFNLRNLIGSEEPVPTEVEVLARLLEVLGENRQLAEPLAALVQDAFNGKIRDTVAVRMLPANVEDIETSDPNLRQVMKVLQPYVTILPVPTPVNVNTATAELLAARFDNLSLANARRLISSRDTATFRDLNDVVSRLGDVQPTAAAGSIAVASRYFVLEGLIEYGGARLHQQALLKRELGRVDLVWRRELRA